MNVTYECVVFMQGDAAERALAILEEKGEQAALDYLCNWHYPGEHEERHEPSHGTADTVYKSGGYILSYNRALSYIGLNCEVAE